MPQSSCTNSTPTNLEAAWELTVPFELWRTVSEGLLGEVLAAELQVTRVAIQFRILIGWTMANIKACNIRLEGSFSVAKYPVTNSIFLELYVMMSQRPAGWAFHLEPAINRLGF